MKFSSITYKAVALAVLTCISGMVSAAPSSNTLTVSASVIGKCVFSTATSTLTFPAIDPSLTTVANATASSVTYQCTKNVNTISIAPTTGGTARTLASTTAGSTATLAYTLAIGTPAGPGAGFGGASLSATLNGTIAASAYQVAPAEIFTEVVLLNITP